MNDKKEFTFAHDYVSKVAKKFAIENEIEMDDDFHCWPYVISFCEEDNLLMWRLYGDNGHGIQLHFDPSKIEGNCTDSEGKLVGTFMKIFYANEENLIEKFRDCYNEYVTNFGSIKRDYESLKEASTFVKRDLFEYEKEYRYAIKAYHGFTMSGPNDIKDHEEIPLDGLRFFTRGDELVSFVDVPFCKEALVGIKVGYSLPYEKTKKELELMLLSRGYHNVEIVEE